MTADDQAQGQIDSDYASAGEGEEAAGHLEEEARAQRRTVQPIRDVPDQLVFRFEVGPAILMMLLEKLEELPKLPLGEALDAKYPGFYQLFLGDDPKYIGKTARPIGQRLREHLGKLRGRQGIDLANVKCRYAFVEDPSLVDVAEGALIDFFSPLGLAEWNTSGFGSKVTGHFRGEQRPSLWSLQYPPSLDLPVTAGAQNQIGLWDLFRQIQSQAPVTISVPRAFMADFRADHRALYAIPSTERPFDEWMQIFEKLLAENWLIDRKPEAWYIVKEVAPKKS